MFRFDTEESSNACEYFINIALSSRGALELAPVLGLYDVIVDIVETGTTLRENNLSVINFIADLSARLIANKAAYKFKGDVINEIIKRIKNDEA